jgi:amino acid adenylation domain-containing protein
MPPQVIAGFRLSPQQERLWRLQQAEARPPFTAACEVRLASGIDAAALAAALRQVAARHEILRTRFRLLPGMELPLQVIAQQPDLALAPADGPPPPFDLAQGPLVRAALEERGGGSFLRLELPSLCADAATLVNLVAELGRCCAGAAAAEEPVQYADLAGWQNERLEAADARARAFWRSRGWPAAPPARLPWEGAGEEATAASSPATVPVPLGPGVGRAMVELAAELGVGAAAVPLAAWLLLLRRLAERPDLVVGIACDGRGQPELAGALGPLVRFLPLQVPTAEAASFAELVADVAAAAAELGRFWDSFDWQGAPGEGNGGVAAAHFPYLFEHVELPAPAGAAAGAPGGVSGFAIEGLRVRGERCRAKLCCLQRGGELWAELEFDAAAVAPHRARLLAGWLAALLRHGVERPRRSCAAFDLLSAGERHALLVEAADTGCDLGPPRTLVELLAAAVEQEPDRVALEWAGGSLTLGELDRRANQLARRLRRLGVGPEAVVGLCVERSPEMVVGLLGILKAGGAWLPLDPAHPPERRRQTLADAGAGVLVAVASAGAPLAEPPLQVLLDRDAPALAAEDGGPLAAGVAPEGLAYVIYTSGSTGQPKGVAVPHRAIANRLLWMLRRFPPARGERVLQKTALSFDASIWELFVPLLGGGTLVLAEAGGQQDPDYLAAAVAAGQADVLQLVPSFLPLYLAAAERALAAASDPGVFARARLFCGGEALDGELAERFLGGLGGRLCNLYGPTEATIDATYHVCRRGEAPGSVPIGRPLANVRVLLLDRHLQPVPPGLPGELYIGGAGLARGYLGRQELTAERFLPDGCSGLAGERLYRTGDFARRAGTGDLEFLGRADGQVKVRGFRIELGEIEAALRRHPAVREAAVAVRGTGPAERRLAAFWVPAAASAATAEELRRHLATLLPEHMVPALWTSLPALPRLASGKLDRQALPVPGEGPAPEEEAAPLPRTPLEELLAGIWCELLGRERVGRHEDFFAAGGDSLLATRLVSRVRELLRVEMRVRALFEAPTVARLAARLAAARPAGAGAPPPLAAGPRIGDLPLSYAQQRLWLLDRLEPGSSAYNLELAVGLRGDLDEAVLAAALAAIVRRHEALRTAFAESGGVPAQRIEPWRGFALPVVDLRRLGEDAAGEARRLVAANARRPFDLGRAPLLRPLLVRLGGADHVLAAVLHHAVSDGWSLGVLVRELGLLYRAGRDRRPARLPALPVQYADFARWQRQWLAGEVLAAEVAWWRERLSGMPGQLALPTDRPRPAVRSSAGAVRWLALPPVLEAGLRRLARQQGATLFMVLLAGFQALLSRWTGQRDFGVGTPIAGRNRLEIEGLIGFFVNTLVLRAELGAELDARELLRRVRTTTLDAYAHQELPFEKLVEELAPARSLAHTPLFEVMLLLHNAVRAGERALDLPGLAVAPFDLPATPARYDLTLTLAEGEGGLVGSLEYAAALFDPASVARLARQLEVLLAALAADPAASVHGLPLLGPGELHQLTREWNDPAAGAWPLDLCVHERFARVASRHPDRVAVSGPAGEAALTYGELAAAAAEIARRLQRLGIGAESRVAIAAERTPGLLAGLLGVLAAGATYLPLDPDYPADRIAHMLADARVAAVLVSPGLAELPAAPRAHRLELRLPAMSAGPPAAAWPTSAALPDGLAYVIYTSGSTGRPKGVQVSHRALMNLLGSMQERLRLGADAVWLAATSLSFDISGLELFLPLLAGGRVALAGSDVARDGTLLAAALASSRATVLQATPTSWQLLAGTGWQPPPGMQRLCGGEALPAALAERLLAGAGEAAPLWNVYGPTETTIWSAALRLGRTSGPAIGRPLARTALHVLDAALAPCPPGVAGELWIAGCGLARGYLGQPDQTAARFCPAPFAGAAGERWYRTGDLVRWRRDGSLDFLGRLDGQVKVRGVRIELAEIEAVLAGHPAVRQAVVQLAGSGAAGGEDQRLIACVVPSAPGEGAAAADLRRFLAARLPAAMVPAEYREVEALPLTPNGKIDRRALAGALLAAGTAAPRGGAAAAPRTPAEEALAGIWCALLERPWVGRDDDFFSLGGHSLLATRLLSRVRELWGVELPLAALFAEPTVAALGARLEAARRAPAPAGEEPLARRPGAPPLLSFAQQRLWFLARLQPGNPYYNLAGALRLRGRLQPAALAAAASEIVRRHETLRTRYREDDGVPLPAVAAALPVPLPLVDLAALPADRRAAAARAQAAGLAGLGFDLAAEDPLRLRLLRLDAGEHLLLFSLHHIAADGWSFGILTAELAALYPAALAAAPSPLPELPVQYADFAGWQRRRLRGARLDALNAFWRSSLAGAPPALALPLDRPRPAGRGGLRVASVPLRLGAEVAALRRLGQGEGATLFMSLLAGFSVLLGRASGQDDVLVGAPVANRTRPELEALIGLFVNTLALRTRLHGDPDFRALLRRVAASTLAAYDHQELPFERLVEELQPERSLERSPLFQALFVLQNAPGAPLALAELELEPIGLGRAGGAQLDLTLALAEDAAGLAGSLEFDPELFDRTTIQRLAGQLSALLAAAAAAPGTRLSELSLLSPPERHQLLAAWNDTAAGERPDACLHELVLAQAARAPQAVAVVWGEHRLSYGDLDRQVAALAARLQRLGVGPEVRVGLALERSADLPVAALAVLAAGGAYVPLDPQYPAERLAFMAADSRLALVLTHQRLLPRLPPLSTLGARVLALDVGGAPDGAAEPAAPAPGAAGRAGGPGNAAYVIYTSGSTGAPKGVVIEHRAAAALVAWAVAAFDREELAGVLAATSICFDLSVFELFVPLAAGGTVILADDVLALPGLPAAGEVTLLNTVPSAMAELLRASAVPASVRTVVLAGEPLRRELAARVWELAGVRTLWNLYGPTEDTTYSTGIRMSRGPRAPTIGRPLAKARAYVLDGAGHPAAIGVAGELWLAGAGLARGYLERAPLTAERFRPDPFAAAWGERGGRLYRTGDLARTLPDGQLELLGRRDHQVKVRGFRIELGEVEAALGALPGVGEAAVVLDDRLPGGGLAAFVSPGSLAGDELRESLRRTLPAPFVPARIVALDALPRTPNGKVDHEALRRCAPAAAAPHHAETAATPAEEVLAAIFAEVLELPRVGREDDFFRLGGHSLLALRVVSRVRRAFGVELPVGALFENPTVAALAAGLAGAPAAALPPLAASGDGGERPLSFAQRRLWFLHRVDPASPAYNIPVAVELEGELAAAALAAALGALVERHQVLRACFPASAEGEPLLRTAPAAAACALPCVDLAALPPARGGDEARRLAAGAARRPFDLARGPLLRALLLRLGAARHRIVLVLHHVAGDGWSLGVMVAELAAHYRGAAAAPAGGRPAAALPPLPVQYADYAAWQQGWWSGGGMVALAGYWQRQLAGAPPLLELPGGRARPAAASGQGAALGRTLAPALAGEIAGLARRSSATLFMTLLAAFQALLAIRTGASDVVVGTDVAGRNRPELEPLVGFFINQLALRTDLRGDPSFEVLLGRVREVTLAAFAHQEMPFDRLVDLLRLPRSLAQAPLFQVKLVLHNLPAGRFDLPGLTLRTLGFEEDTAQLDLNLRVRPAGGALHLSLQYSTDLYEAAGMAGLLADFEDLLRRVSAAPAARLSELAAALREAEHERWLAREKALKGARRGQLAALRRRGGAGSEAEAAVKGQAE